jgi:hypothetical protein
MTVILEIVGAIVLACLLILGLKSFIESLNKRRRR